MANEYLKRTPTSTGNRLKATWSFWVKRNKLEGTSTSTYLFYAVSGSGADAVRYNDDDGGDSLRALFWNGTNNGGFINYDKLRDTSSWQHYLIVYDSTLNTTDNFSNNDQTLERIKIFVNGRRMIETGGNSAQNTGVAENQLLTRWGNAGIVNALFAEDDGASASALQTMDTFFVDGQALTPDVFGFYKDGNGYISAGSTQATDFRPGQWVPKAPRVIKAQIERNGGFGVNGFYLPMNDSSNFGADFHTTPNSIITLKGEDLPQPRNGAPETTDAYVSQLREDPYADNLVLAIPGIVGGASTGYGDYSADIKGSGSNKTVTANGNAGVAVTASYYGSALSFDGTNDYFTIPNNNDFYFDGDFTVECWIYRNVTNTSEAVVGVFENSSARRSWQMETRSSSSFRFEWWSDGSSNQTIDAPSNGVPGGQWNHVAMVKQNDTMAGYINGVAVGVDTTAGAIYENTVDPLRIGILNAAEDQDFNGYIQDLRVYKGVAKYKGGFDVPKPYTPVGIATWRAVPDTTANNFATLNALQSSTTLTDGNLTCTGSGSDQETYSTVGITTGKWYVEARTNVGTYNHFGLRANSNTTYDTSYRLIARDDGNVYRDTSEGQVGTLSDNYNQAGDIVAMAIDGDNGQVTYYINGVNVGGPYSIYQYSSPPTPYKVYNLANSGDSLTLNFGQNPTFSGQTTAGTFTDSNGKGLFKYEPPSGFLALCEDNLPTPAIKNPGEHFKTVLWTGDGNSGRNITGIGFTPDLVWIKPRNFADQHVLCDSIRGPLVSLYINTNTETNNGVLGFNDDGFALNNWNNVNDPNDQYVAWCWRAGAGTTSTNTDGSITSVVSVNQDAGFSIIKVDSLPASTTSTFGHGLNKKPDFIIFKSRNNSTNWDVYHSSLTPDGERKLYLNGTNAEIDSGFMGDTPPTSSVISFNPGSSVSNHIVYCWTEIEGFSKFGSYIGNGNADGPFVYCGFKPAFILLKKSSTTGNWNLFDSSRNSTNPVSSSLFANLSDIENTTSSYNADFLSNGFKVRTSDGSWNDSGVTYIFATFAESPINYSNAK